MKKDNFGLLGLKIFCAIVLLISVFTMIYCCVTFYNSNHNLMKLGALIILLCVILLYETDIVINILKLKTLN